MQHIAEILGREPKRLSAFDQWRLQQPLPGFELGQPPRGPGRPRKDPPRPAKRLTALHRLFLVGPVRGTAGAAAAGQACAARAAAAPAERSEVVR